MCMYVQHTCTLKNFFNTLISLINTLHTHLCAVRAHISQFCEIWHTSAQFWAIACYSSDAAQNVVLSMLCASQIIVGKITPFVYCFSFVWYRVSDAQFEYLSAILPTSVTSIYAWYIMPAARRTSQSRAVKNGPNKLGLTASRHVSYVGVMTSQHSSR